MKHVFFISFEILGSHAQITEMKFTRAIGRTRVFLLAELPAFAFVLLVAHIRDVF